MLRAAALLALALIALASCVTGPAAMRERGVPGPRSISHEIPQAGGAGGGSM